MHLKLHDKNSLTKSLGPIKLPEAGTTKGVTSQGNEPCMKKVLIECSKEVDVKPGMCRHEETVLMDSQDHTPKDSLYLAQVWISGWLPRMTGWAETNQPPG
jgi:hypothetical protein